jgi:hypothetical protein
MFGFSAFDALAMGAPPVAKQILPAIYVAGRSAAIGLWSNTGWRVVTT